MFEEWRSLLYPLGYLSGLAFACRFLIQWLASEKRKQSYCPPIFWQLSLLGNCLLAFHGIIQLQYHVSIVQCCNGVIAWRNLNLMHPQGKRAQLRTVIAILVFLLSLITLLFFGQGYLSNEDINWFRSPMALSATSAMYRGLSPILLWHVFGFFGMLLFSSRFWVQWWYAEKYGCSELSAAFWWLSLVGDVMTLTYFFSIGDPVNFIGPLFGLIPYIRNLMLINRQKAA